MTFGHLFLEVTLLSVMCYMFFRADERGGIGITKNRQDYSWRREERGNDVMCEFSVAEPVQS